MGSLLMKVRASSIVRSTGTPGRFKNIGLDSSTLLRSAFMGDFQDGLIGNRIVPRGRCFKIRSAVDSGRAQRMPGVPQTCPQTASSQRRLSFMALLMRPTIE
jgi:hypothetical protein